jgi:mRNA deadenylase 3'-5' endonuclease subunit Ccr4
MDTSPTFLLDRKIVTVSPADAALKTVSILQWNVLNPNLCDHDHFTIADVENLDWNFRKSLFQKELPMFNADFVCLEEVHRADVSFYTSCLDTNKYEVLYKERLSGLDGCLFFYDKNKYIHIHGVLGALATSIHVYQLHLFQIRETQKYIWICFTHLQSQKENENERVKQIKYLLEKIDQEVAEFDKTLAEKKEKIGLLFCGDLNSEPDWETIQKIRDWNKTKSTYDIDEFTTFKIKKGLFLRTIDYIWRTENLKVLEKLSMPSKERIGEKGLPNKDYPSDHLSIYAKFEF